MFFFNVQKNGDGDDLDIEDMTIREIALKVNEIINEPDFIKTVVDIELTTEQRNKALAVITEIMKLDPNVKEVTRDMVIGFKSGYSYGMALTAKTMSGEPPTNKKDGLKFVKKIMFMPVAINNIVKNWDDTTWFENLMKNAKIIDPNTTKNAATIVPKDGRKKKK